jgi:hypothetical protein
MADRWIAIPILVTRWALSAAAAGTLGFATEQLRMAALGQSPLRWSAHWALWSGHVLFALLAVALAASATGLVRLLPARIVGGVHRQAVLAGVLAVAPLAAALVAAGGKLIVGAWISQQSFAPLVAWGPLLAALACAPVLLFLSWNPASADAPARRRDVGLLATVAVLAVADHEVAPGLYPEFHMVLQALCSCSALCLAWRRLARRTWASDGAGAWIPLGAGLFAILATPLGWFRMSPYVRAALVLRAPVAGNWIRYAMPQRPWTPLHYVLGELDVHAGRYTGDAPPTNTDDFERKPSMNVVFVVADTLRADALPPARPAEGTAFAEPGDTPRLDAWLEGAYRFRYAYSASTETKRAMPAMFRSIEASDDPITYGVPLGQRLELLGLDPIAVVHRYFMPAKYPAVAALFDGFGEVRVYENPATDTAIPQALELLEARRDRQTALFLHLYTVHKPGFDGRVISGRGRVKNYRRALRYLDRQMGELLDGLERIGLRDRTMIVFLGDHGEGLGDHGVMLHGPTTFEEDIRVPFAIEIPGHGGKIIEETVGTIDFAPTLADLLGAPADLGDRGRSLVPLLIEEPQQPDRGYYFENNKATTVGVVVGRDKLIYEKGVDVAYRFDIASDPDERLDLHDPDGEVDRMLIQRLVEFQPRVAKEELDDAATLDLLRAHLEELDPDAPGAALPLLARLVSMVPERDLVIRCGEIFEEADDPAVRLLLIRYLLERAPEAMTPRVTAWLQEIADTPRELEVVAGLARQGQPEFAPETVSARMLHYAAQGDASTWDGWLRLVSGWENDARDFGAPLAKMLERATTGTPVPDHTLVMVLENAAALVGSSPVATDIGGAAMTLSLHPRPRVRAAAVRALGGVRHEAALATIRDRLLAIDEDVRVRREAAAALTAVAGDDAIPDFEVAAREVAMTTLIVRHLRDHGTKRAIPLLERVLRTDVNEDTRVEARKAVEKIRDRTENPGTK